MIKGAEVSNIRSVQRCNECVLPEDFPNIAFDNKGMCNYCKEYKPLRLLGEDRLLRLLNHHKAKGRMYDCLVPVSGGKDSAFVLQQLADVYACRVLAFHYDSGFCAEEAIENVERMTQVLGVDLVKVKSNRSLQKRLLRKTISVWCRNPEIIPQWCLGCQNGIEGGAFRVAKAIGVPLVVQGGFLLEESLFKRKVTMYDDWTLKHVLINLVRNPLYYPMLFPNYVRSMIEFPNVNAHATTRRVLNFHGIDFIHFYDFVEYDEKQILSTVEKNFGWKRAKDNPSTWHMDCEVHALVDYVYRTRFGFTEKDEYYSNMIREGMIDREEGLRRIDEESKTAGAMSEVMERLFDKLDLPPSERDCILYSVRGRSRTC